MAEEKKKQSEVQLNEEQLDEVAGGMRFQLDHNCFISDHADWD